MQADFASGEIQTKKNGVRLLLDEEKAKDIRMFSISVENVIWNLSLSDIVTFLEEDIGWQLVY